MNLVLIGYRGTGKSTIGKILAAELDLEYVCLDDEIAALAGMTIPEIVKAFSWEHFRDLEEQVVKVCTGRDGQVLDTGGGVITRLSNIPQLKESGIVFLLTATVEDIVRRIGSNQGRPSLKGTKSFTDEVVEVLTEREPLYREAAHFTMNTSQASPRQIARQVAEQFRKSCQ